MTEASLRSQRPNRPNDEYMRLTKSTIGVLEALLAASDDRPVWGQAIAHDMDLEPSSVSLILKRLRERGWIESWPEDDAARYGRNRLFHELTPIGYQRAMRALLARQERRNRMFGS